MGTIRQSSLSPCLFPVVLDHNLHRAAVRALPNVRYLTTGQVGRILGVGHGAVAHWIRAGLLPAVRRGNRSIAFALDRPAGSIYGRMRVLETKRSFSRRTNGGCDVTEN